MKKVYIIENLDCANCAAKIEAKFNAHPQVVDAAITFSTRQLRLEAEDPDALIPKLQAIARTVESGAQIHARERRGQEQRHEHKCGCGHDHHEHDHQCHCGHDHHEHDHQCHCGHDHHEHDHQCHCGHDHHEHDHQCHCGHDHHGHDHQCHCGHDHQEHDHQCHCGHDHHGHDHRHDHKENHGHVHEVEDSPKPLFIGGGLFVLGLLLEHLGLGWLSIGICAAAYILLGREIVAKAVSNLRKGQMLDENFLMAVASIGAFFIGNAPEGVGVMLFYRVGEYFEHRAVERSRSQIMEAVDLRPEVVQLVRGDSVTEIPAEAALPGDLLLVRPGDRIPLDGIVAQGESRIDTAPITGEPVPVRVAQGDAVTSGCLNTTGQLILRVEKPLRESMVTRILDSVENAAASKPKIDRFITRFARIYTPIVVAVAAITAIVPSVLTGNWSYWVYTALSFLVMSCPCALVLSVPLAFFAGIGAGSKRGILFKGGVSMEAMGKVKAVVMDKTGTITKGEFKVQSVAGGHDVLALCASCEQLSTHPIAQSIVTAAKERHMELFQPDTLEEIPGQGIRATADGRTILCGNERLLTENGVEAPRLEGAYGTKVLVAVSQRFVGYILIADTVKEGAKEAVEVLNKQGIHTVMLTGDNRDSAEAVAQETGIAQVHAGLLPHQKLEALQTIRAAKGAAMFVGDGINDAPVLAGADVGAAMGAGADAAIEAADVVFMTNDVSAIPLSLQIAKQTQTIAWQNVIFALAVKFLVMALGLLGHASMWLAVFADSGVAMLCVLNSIRMLYKK